MKRFLIVSLLAAGMHCSPVFAQEWRQLFNGTDLTGWEQIGPGKFKVVDGTLQTSGGMGMLFYPGEKFQDVVIRVVFMVESEGANSGVFIRIPETPKNPMHAVNTGYEVQIDDGTKNKGNDEYRITGGLYSLTKVMAKPKHVPGQWYTMEITLDGNKTIVFVEGEKIIEFTEGDEVPAKMYPWDPNRGPRPDSGFIGLQNHADDDIVYFKEIAIRPLKKGN